jgi:aminoglycoside phosphotransferase (APT) family kinase protein
MNKAPWDWDRAIGDLLSALGHRVDAVRALRGMSTSRVWRVDTDLGSRAVRVGFPRPGKVPRFAADALVRRRLVELDRRVAQPIAHSWERADLNHLVQGRAWAVDSYIDGEDGRQKTVGKAAWSDLGGLLVKLHGLPVEGMEGTAATRFSQAWPLDPNPLADHPIAAAAPDLPNALAPFEAESRAAAGGPRVVLHGDPAAYNLRLRDGRLVGLIDFNDTFVGPPAWDFAWIAAYGSWPSCEATLLGYQAVDASFPRNIRLLAIPTALHSASRAALLDQPSRMVRMVDFLRETVRELAG